MGERFTTSQGYSGRASIRFRKEVLAIYGTVCHLCGAPGANSVDHVIPRSVRPDLAYVIENARPAHLSCNSARGAAPLSSTYVAPAW